MSPDRVSQNRSAFAFALFALAFLIFVTVFGAALDYWVNALFVANLKLAVCLGLLIVLVAFVILFFQYDRVNEQVTASAEVIDIADIPDRRFLVCGYSPLAEGELVRVEIESLGTDPTEIAKAEKWEPYKWQQNVRVINALPGIERVYVILPNEDQFDKFAAVISKVFRNRAKAVEVVPVRGLAQRKSEIEGRSVTSYQFSKGVWRDATYEDYNYVTSAIDWAFAAITKDYGLTSREMQRQVAIDVTSGIKIFSVAAAVASLNRETVFVYASTDPSAHADGRGVTVLNARVELFKEGLRL